MSATLRALVVGWGAACAPVPYEPVDEPPDLEPVDTATEPDPDSDSDTSGDGIEDGPRLTLTLARAPSGRPAEPEDCGPDSEFVGRTSGAVVCLVAHRHAAAWLDPTSPDAHDCPARADWVGGFAQAEICAFERPTSVVYVREDADNRRACPQGSDLIGTLGADLVCATPGAGDAIRLDRDRAGRSLRDVSDPAEICPRGWTFVGFQDSGVVCTRRGPPATLRVAMDIEGRPWSAELEPELCPPEFVHLGGAGYAAVCGHASPQEVVVLDENPLGLSTRQIGQPGKVCPSGFRWAGNVGWNAICTRTVPPG